jgi:hypothetical protein
MDTVFGLLWIPGLEARGWFAPWLALVLGALAVAAVVVLYVKEAGRLPLSTRLALAGVRSATVVVVAFLLLRPVYVRENEEVKSRPIGVLVDISESMDSADPRASLADQGRVAIAMGLSDARRGLPDAAALETIGRGLPQKPKRIEVAAAALTNTQMSLFPRLAEVGPLEVFTFGTRRTGRTPKPDDWIKTVPANEPQTAIAQAAFEMINREDLEAPAALVIVTDGRQNAGQQSLAELAQKCQERRIPIHVYGVGSSSFGQLRTAFGAAASKDKGTRVATDIDAPSTLFVDDTAAIPVRYTIKGVPQGEANLVLKYGDREVVTRTEPFSLTPEEMRDGKTFSTVLRFVPTKVDAESKKQEYSVTVTVTTGAGDAADVITNTLSRPSQVVSRKLKVLMVDSLPRRDFQFLQRALLRDRRVEAKFFLTEGDKQAMRSGPPWMVEFSREVNGVLNMDAKEFRQTLFEFDLLILGDVPDRFFTREQQEVIKEFVAEGAGLIHIAGRWHAPAEWAPDRMSPGARNDPNPIAELLPVEFEQVRFPIQAPENPTGFVPVLAPNASRTQIVSLLDDHEENAQLWGQAGPQRPSLDDRQLKPLYWYYPVTRVKPAADVFLTHPTARTPDDKPMPLLAGHHYGKGYVLYVGFDDTWRWRFNTQEKLFGRFWTQAVYTAGVPRIVGTRRTQLSTDTPSPVVGEAGGVFRVDVFDQNYQRSTAETVEGTLERLDAKDNDPDRVVPVTFHKVPGVDGSYVLTLPPFTKPGQFRLSVDARNNAPAGLSFPVNYRDNHERAPAALDEEAMRTLCEATGGGFYREENLVNLPDGVKKQTARFYQKEEHLLWDKWAMILLVLLLTAEWFLRKFNGLS